MAIQRHFRTGWYSCRCFPLLWMLLKLCYAVCLLKVGKYRKCHVHAQFPNSMDLYIIHMFAGGVVDMQKFIGGLKDGVPSLKIRAASVFLHEVCCI